MTDMIQVRRFPITPELRQLILERDNFACRYCGSKKPPFHLDHVYPVSKGGETSEDNLVTSCSDCNQKKHNKVGIYPKPIGYFEKDKFRKYHLFVSPIILGTLITVIFWFALSETNQIMRTFDVLIGFICWIPIIKDLIKSVFERN